MRLLAILACILLVSCGAPTPEQLQPTIEAAIVATQAAQTATADVDTCSDAALVAYADAVELLLDRYEAQADVTGSTPRASLGGPLQRLVDYEDEARALETPACLTDFSASILTLMQRYRQGYQTFAAQGSQPTIDAALTAGRQGLADVRGALPSIRAGTLPGPIVIP